MRDCIESLRKDGWSVYTRGMPSVIAEKGCFMRMIVVTPKVNLGKGVMLGRGKDALSRAFYKCFGIKYEVWGGVERFPEDREWV